ncbi:hypothetical protein PRZ48_001954 [Zasmidium cellare]|uniref:Uncharacterized protein n=1 Tax=Zasmidium cellare TaxID=395010 RepID=A0ABR0F2N8_ZASCE|nr:hypothetical protein PRZ48_001954 [Zasmidium cellare]
MALLASITAAPSCASCLFGATETTKYSYTAYAVQTVNVTIIPHITTFTNRPNVTNYETLTQTQTIYVGGDNSTATNLANATTFKRPEDITWTVGDATLTYSTTYIEYLGFAGAAPSNAACAQDTNAYGIELPQSTARESFIYPYTEGDTILPSELLDYLGSIPTITEQIDGAVPAACAPLTITPGPSLTYTTVNLRREAKKYEGARRDATPSQAAVEVGGNNSTNWLATSGTVPHHTGGSDVGFVPTYYGSSTSSYYYSVSETRGIDVSTAPLVSGPANDHTTAFVLNTVTGRAIVVPGDTAEQVVVGPEPTPTDDTVERPSSPSIDDEEPPQVTQPPSQPSIPELIQSAAEGQQTDSQQSAPANNIPDIVASAAAAQNSGSGGDSNQDSPPPASQGPVFNVGTTIVSADSQGSIQIGTQVLTPGQTVDIGSGGSPTPAALVTSGGSTQLIIDGSTYRPAADTSPAATAAPAVFTADGKAYTVIQDGDSFVVAGGSSTFALPTGSTLTVGSVEIGAPSDGSGVVVDGSTLAVPQVTPPPTALVTAGEQTFSASQSDGSIIFVDGSSTIEVPAGSQTIVDGHTFSVGPNGNAMIVDGSTVSIGNAASPTPTEIVVTANRNTFTAVDESGSVILRDGSSTVTVRDGAQTAFEGQSISVLPDGKGIVVNGSITTSFGGSATTTGLGDYINGGLGESATSTGGSTGASTTSENDGARIRTFTSAGLVGVVLGVLIIL